MDGKRLIEKIRLQNILSFGDKGEEIELQPLNIIIGQNASGKSNLVDVIKLLRSLPEDKGLVNFISINGGIFEWAWKGKRSEISQKLKEAGDFFFINAQFNYLEKNVEYRIIINELSRRPMVVSEELKFLEDNKIISKDIKTDYEESMLSRSSITSSEISDLRLRIFAINLSKIRSYSDLQTTRKSEMRKPQPPDALNDFLQESGSNLSLVLSDLSLKVNIKDKIIENLKKFNPLIKDYLTVPSSGAVQLYLSEEGLDTPISAMRLSDGTMRYLCLLAILCHPEPPPLICIEEPEMGLHPDILPTIAELMKEAAQRTQLIVTTHSDILVSAFSDMPEAILVCEKDDDGTHFKRLKEDELKVWLEEYTLGEVWMRGGIGGTRW